MYIPKVILDSSKEYSPDSKAIQQNFAKKYKKLSSGNKSSNSSNNGSHNKENPETNKLQSDIFTWLFELDLTTRIKVCSIHSKWISKVLLQLSLFYKYDNDVFFQLISNDSSSNHQSMYYNNMNQKYYEVHYDNGNDNNDEDNDDEDDEILFTRFYKVESQIVLSKDKEMIQRKKKENEFLQMIQCISHKSYNDTILLKKAVLTQKDKFEYFFKKFSNNQIFNSWLSVVTEENSAVYNFTPTKWMIPEEKYSLISIFISYFEYSILLNYQYYYYTKQIYGFSHYAKIDELLESITNLESFLKEENIEDTFELGVLNGIIEKIRESEETKNEMKKQKIINEKIFHIHFKNSYYLGERVIDYNTEKIMKELKDIFKQSIEQFVEMITFIDLDAIFNFNAFIFKELRRQIENLFVNKNISELLMVSSPTEKKKNSKKKKKKKQAKKVKEEAINLNNNTEKMSDLNNNSPISELIEDDKLTKNAKSTLDQDNHFHNDIDIDDSNKNIRIKQKKPIYLFPNPKTKTQKAIPHSNNDNDNNISETDQEINNDEPNCKLANQQLQIEANHIKMYSALQSQQQTQALTITPNESKEIKESNNLTEQRSTIQLKSSPQLTSVIANTNQSNKNRYQTNFITDFKYPYYQQSQSLLFPNSSLATRLQRYPYSMQDPFYSSLILNISLFAYSVIKNNALLKPYKEKCKLKIEELIQYALEPKYIYRLLYFGSYASNLAIENSDIDILIIYKSKSKEHFSIETIIGELVSSLNNSNELFDYIKPIPTASIPVIKLQCDYNKEMDFEVKQSVEFEYLFNKVELIKVKFDISFMEENDETISIPSEKRNEYIKEAIALYPDIKPLMAIMKRLMQKKNLNSSFKGGLSSYSLFLMILSYLKYLKQTLKENRSIGYILYHLLSYYGSIDYSKYVIDSSKDNPFIRRVTHEEIKVKIITITDPITNHNVAKSSFRVEEIQTAFQQAEHYLKQCSFNYSLIGQGSIITSLFAYC